MKTIRTLLEKNTPLFIDGAMGTMLQSLGMPAGVNPAEYCMDKMDIVAKVHTAYFEAGADIILTATFGGSSYKLPESLTPYQFNKAMAQNAKNVAHTMQTSLSRPLFVAGDIGPVGHFIKPLGDLEPQDFINAIREQVKGLVDGGVDLIFIETQFDIAEARAAVAATRMECDLPIFVSMTFEDGVSLTGSTPEIYAATMQNMGVDAIGVNCGAGPEQMLPVVQKILASSTIPVFAEPNAGLPELIDGETVFRLMPKDFAIQTTELFKHGVTILGGCCGTSPEHIRELRHHVLNAHEKGVHVKQRALPYGVRVTSRSRLVSIGKNSPITLIGERINPTGKKLLTAEFQEGKFSLALQYAAEQIALGTEILDVNVGAPNVIETSMLPQMVENLVARHDCPLCIDSSNPDAIIAALPWYPGSVLVNSISGEEGKMQKLAPHCKIWGSPFILLPLQGANLPSSAQERITIIEKLIKEAETYKIPQHLIMIDILALTAASDAYAPRACLETVAWCHKHNIATTLGLSNISFGLPARELVNASFLSLAAGAGLTSCIANPSSHRIREALDTANILMGHDNNATNFTRHYAEWKATDNAISTNHARNISITSTSATLEDAIIRGDKDHIIAMVEEELQKGADPFILVRERLIPAIQEVGSKYERKEYFLPQLLQSASTMQTAFNHVKPLLEKSGQQENRPKILIATVQGDIHDIGKNILGLLLSNHGYEIIDLGKDVPSKAIIDAAIEHDVAIIGLSALMTTTMPRMEETIKLAREKKLTCKIMIGGAVVTPEYAESIGADAYAADAVEAVRVTANLLNT